MSPLHAKRLFDLIAATLALIVSIPLQAAVAVLVAVKLGRPVLFRQTRPGLHGKPFTIMKFRTMLPVDASRGWTDDDSRMTPVGRALRATSLDELPTIWNIVRGDMSMVGPRPLLMQYLGRYTPEQSRRHQVQPGLTGLAQVAGRNALSWEEKFLLDIAYVDHHSLRLDVRILWATVAAVVRRVGITAEGESTMREFMGSTDSVMQ